MKKYLRKIKGYITNVGDFTDLVNDAINEALSPPSNFANFISGIVMDYFNKYSELEYHFIPMELSDDYEKDFEKIINYLYFKLRHRKYLFDKANEIAGSYEIIIPSGNKNITTYDTVTINDREGTKTVSYGKQISKDVDGEEYRVSDESPISSDITVLDTPSQKNKISTDSNVTDTYSGNDSTDDDWTLNETKSGTDTNENLSPELFKNFVIIAENYNIYNLIETTLRSIIYEFNMVM